jgi:hypothetical protein
MMKCKLFTERAALVEETVLPMKREKECHLTPALSPTGVAERERIC